MALTLSTPLSDGWPPDHLLAHRALLSSAWHGVWLFSTTSPWFAIVLMVPAVALLVRCTRLTVRRG